MAPMAPPERLSAVDAAWLRMDAATNPMVITAVLVLDGALDHAAEAELVGRLVAHPRFRQRAVAPALGVGAWRWEDAPGFDPALHVHRIGLPRPGGDAALADLVGDLMSSPLDHARPLWQLHVVEMPAGTALVARIHHAMGDGVALVGLLLAIVGLDVQPEDVGIFSSPSATVGDVAERTAGQALALGKLLLLPADPATPFKGPQSSRKRVAWSRAYPLDAIKRAAHSLDAKVNDVLLASVTAGVRSYFEERRAMRDGLEVHAIVPVFFRGSGEGLGNHFGLVFAALPLGSSEAHDRVRAVKLRMDRIKASPEAQVAFAILAATGVASPEIESIVVDLFSRKGSVMVTNIPGPPVPLAMAGLALEKIVVWAPTSGHVAVGVTLLSYAGSVRMSIATDVALVPDPERVVAGFEADLDALTAPR